LEIGVRPQTRRWIDLTPGVQSVEARSVFAYYVQTAGPNRLSNLA